MNAITNLEMNNEKVDLIKRTFCKNSTDEELELFVHACRKTGLDPFMRQIYAVKRYDGNLRREVMQIQTGIDGYRLIADRTGRYAPGRETTFSYASDGKLVSSTAYIKKQTPDGTWHEVSATAYYEEYACMTKGGGPNIMWATKGHIMLSKCAEACALRKAFPAELSGIYTKEEMEQADNLKIKAETQIQLPEPTETTDDDFKKIFSAEHDAERVSEYVKAAASHYSKDVSAIKAMACENPERFLNNFAKWISMQEKKAG